MALTNFHSPVIRNLNRLSINYFRPLCTQNVSGDYDIVFVGGGIIGVGTAREILIRHPKLRIAIVEKERALACHQSRHNSGVVHAGVYYVPGSLKAKLCVEGMKLLFAYCDEKKVPLKKIGKLIVATNEAEVKRLQVLIERGKKNNVPDMQVLTTQEEIHKVEPHCKGMQAIWSPHTSIVDYREVTLSFAKDFEGGGGQIFKDFEVISFSQSFDANFPVIIQAKNGFGLRAKYVFTCGGLYSDRLAVMSDCPKEPQIIPFRGEYLKLHASKVHLVKGNIYPVPDPRFPFLGVHFTPKMNGDVLLGPNAVLAFKREGYTWGAFNMKEFTETITYPGFRKMAFKFIKPGTDEMVKSLIRSRQIEHLKRYIPEVTVKDVTPGLAGVRAQAMKLNGDLVEDFVFDKGIGPMGKRIFHCRNAPSPAATGSMAIAKLLADKAEDAFQLK